MTIKTGGIEENKEERISDETPSRRQSILFGSLRFPTSPDNIPFKASVFLPRRTYSSDQFPKPILGPTLALLKLCEDFSAEVGRAGAQKELGTCVIMSLFQCKGFLDPAT